MPTKADKLLKENRKIGMVAVAAATVALACSLSPPASAEDFEIKWPQAMRERGDLIPKDRKRVSKVTRPTEDFSKPERFETMSGGSATTKKLPNHDAFSQSSANLSFEEEETFKLGNALFRKMWVSSPSSTDASDGLGPLFNSRSCQTCHLKDGRGHPPEGSADATSMFLRLARGPATEDEREALKNFLAPNLPDPVYGGQLQDKAIPGLLAEGKMVIEYADQPFTYPDGTEITLRKPSYSAENLNYGPLAPDTTLSPRVANPMIGMGLLQAIHPADLIVNADPDDADGDGISGRVALARGTKLDDPVIGRFGWKAQNASIREQSSEAFAGDIGISNPLVPRHAGDCTEAQVDCLNAPNGVQERLGETEAPDPVMDLVTFYSENLAVPARRDVDDPEVLRGKEMFYTSGCTACHTPKFVTSRKTGNKAHAFQLIWPYSDMLLHDMGDGLADGQVVGIAGGSEWRTPPLWGIGLTETVSGHTFFLHDGRARNLEEAILWHGGEAEASRDAYAALEKKDRDALIRFLNSL
ncbi:MAG: thiol oxidoreductase [Rhizobiales bacterium]|nr:thiol oxidoreductase [Hyphomicrobiales bacterium]MBA68754.1 thiol oxidoreductase [Hyphomicrobiales bacterium]